MELKPQQFDLSGKEYSYSAYVKAVKTAVTTKIRGKDLQRYLLALLNYTAGTLSKTKMEELAKIYSSSSQVKSQEKNIKKYYGEVLGPIWTIQNNAFGDTPNKTKAKIFHPTAENEPLTDYEVRYPRQNKPGLKNRQLQTNKSKNTTAKRLVDSMLANNRISAKSGTTTNTVKSQDIISLVVQRKDIHKFWKDSKQWGVLEILADNSTALGPLKAAKYLNEQEERPGYLKLPVADKLISLFEGRSAKEVLAMKVEDILTPAQIQDLKPIIQNNNTLSSRYLTNGGVITNFKNEPLIVGYICVAIEYRIQDLSRDEHGLLFYELFSDAVSGLINYVTFDLTKDFMPKWSGMGTPELENVDGFMRAKNTLSTRLARRGMPDALGFQPNFH